MQFACAGSSVLTESVRCSQSMLGDYKMCEMHKNHFMFNPEKASLLSAKANEPNKPLKVSRVQWASILSECGMTVGIQMALAFFGRAFKVFGTLNLETKSTQTHP